MGLGTCNGDFEVMSEDKYEQWLCEDEEQDDAYADDMMEISDDDSNEASMLLMGIDQSRMGHR